MKKIKIVERIRLYIVFFYKNYVEIRVYRIVFICFKIVWFIRWWRNGCDRWGIGRFLFKFIGVFIMSGNIIDVGNDLKGGICIKYDYL